MLVPQQEGQGLLVEFLDLLIDRREGLDVVGLVGIQLGGEAPGEDALDDHLMGIICRKTLSQLHKRALFMPRRGSAELGYP